VVQHRLASSARTIASAGAAVYPEAYDPTVDLIVRANKGFRSGPTAVQHVVCLLLVQAALWAAVSALWTVLVLAPGSGANHLLALAGLGGVIVVAGGFAMLALQLAVGSRRARLAAVVLEVAMVGWGLTIAWYFAFPALWFPSLAAVPLALGGSAVSGYAVAALLSRPAPHDTRPVH
jgi:hypothetical protein